MIKLALRFISIIVIFLNFTTEDQGFENMRVIKRSRDVTKKQFDSFEFRLLYYPVTAVSQLSSIELYENPA